MSVQASFRDGFRRVNSAPLLLFAMYGVTLLVALPLAIVLAGLLDAHLGTSLAADTAASGVNYDWWQEFASQAEGLGTTFVPAIVGFAAVLGNLSALADNLPLTAAVAGVISAWLVIWSFLSGGIIDRYARQRPTHAAGFFAAAGTHFWRFARLGVLALLVYYVLFAAVHPFLFKDVYPRLTRDMTVERTAFIIRACCYLVFGVLLILSNLVFDYARVRIVVEDRRSALGAVIAGARFVRRRRDTLALYLLNAAAWLVVVLAYALLSPGAPGAGVRMWLTLALGQLYVFFRHYTKLLFYASETSFFQRALAHATYTAAPAVVWPESPAAEAILNADSVAP